MPVGNVFLLWGAPIMGTWGLDLRSLLPELSGWPVVQL